ncbi:MAG: DUF86 domain-containing protein [Candidatus Thorarchaeota archaeon]
MKPTRLARYKEKIQQIISNFKEIRGVMPSPEGIILKGVYYNVHSAIESSMDILAMICKDLGIVPKGDAENIHNLTEKAIIDEALANELSMCNGLRNVLVHQYNGIDRKTVLESVPKVERALRALIESLEKYLDED